MMHCGILILCVASQQYSPALDPPYFFLKKKESENQIQKQLNEADMYSTYRRYVPQSQFKYI